MHNISEDDRVAVIEYCQSLTTKNCPWIVYESRQALIEMADPSGGLRNKYPFLRKEITKGMNAQKRKDVLENKQDINKWH
jgi:hypothetical protein